MVEIGADPSTAAEAGFGRKRVRFQTVIFPDSPSARDAWIVARRGPRNRLDPTSAYASFIENETDESGHAAEVTTVFLTNRECPWRCLMCDLWQNTLEVSVPPGAIPAQISKALTALHPSGIRHPASVPRPFLKLYNAGSFFDTAAIPHSDYEAIARLCSPFDRVIVESHPALINRRFDEFHSLLQIHREGASTAAVLEVALGLETIHPVARDRLNKRVSLDQFRTAACRVVESGALLRCFVLVAPPFLGGDDPIASAVETARFAFDCGASVVALIPTRGGNGAMEQLLASGDWTPPGLVQLEQAFDLTLAERPSKRSGVRVFVDTWDLERFSACPACFSARKARLERMNHHQKAEAPLLCVPCRR